MQFIQISEIQSKSDTTKSQIESCLAEREAQVEKLLAQLHNKVDALQSARTEVTSVLRDYHVTELIRVKEGKLGSLKAAGDLEDIRCSYDWKIMALKYKGKTFKVFNKLLKCLQHHVRRAKS